MTTDQQSIVEKTATFAQETLQDLEGGHDWFHTKRVWQNAQQIAVSEPVDQFVVEIGALLHDIAEPKFHNGDEEVGPRVAKEFLTEHNLPEEMIEHVQNIIRFLSFKNSRDGQKWTSPELEVVQDADRLDAIGAIGIARTFMYGGHKGNKIYDPSIKPNLQKTKEEYKKGDQPTINHFYEKLLLLKDKMNTDTGKKLAAERHAFMEKFLEQFYAEWEGKR